MFAGITLGAYDWRNDYSIKLQSGDRALNESEGTDPFAGVRAQLLVAGGRVMLVATGEHHRVSPGGLIDRVSYDSVGLGLAARF